MKTNEFVLPKKWQVKWNEEIGKYYASKSNECYLSPWEYLKNINGRNQNITDDETKMDASFSAYSDLDWEEITFDQFKEHVLKEIPKPEYDPKDVAFNQRPVMGYKFKNKDLLETFKSIYDGFVPWCDSFDLLPDNILKKKLQNLGVIELWFNPVYEAITLKSGVKLSEEDIAEVKEILNNK